MSKHLNTIFAGLALVVAVIGVWLQFRDRSPEITMTISGKSNLNTPIKTNNLATKYFYKGVEVDNVWTIYINISNSGATTIVGTGSNSQLIDNRLIFSIENSEKILGINKISGPESQELEIIDNKEFQIKLDQLLPGEKITAELVLEGSTEKNEPSVTSKRRSLINGEIKISDQSKTALSNVSNNAPTWIPSWLWKTMRGFAIPVFYISGFAFLITFFKAISTLLTIYTWRKKGAIDLANFIINAMSHSDSEDVKQSMRDDLALAGRPWKLSPSMINVYKEVNSNIKNVAKQPMFEGLIQGIFTSAIFFILFSLNIYAAIVIQYYQ